MEDKPRASYQSQPQRLSVKTIFIRWLLAAAIMFAVPVVAARFSSLGGVSGAALTLFSFLAGLAIGIGLVRQNRRVQGFIIAVMAVLVFWLLGSAFSSNPSGSSDALFSPERLYETGLLVLPFLCITWFVWNDRKTG